MSVDLILRGKGCGLEVLEWDVVRDKVGFFSPGLLV